MSKRDTDIRFVPVQYNKYVRTPEKEYPSNDWVLNGINNSHYDYLIERYKGSTTHASICNSYIDLTIGKGLTITGFDTDSQETKDFYNIFPKKEHKKTATDNQLFEEIAFQVIKKNDGSLDKILHIDKYKVVPSLEDENGEITSYWYSRDWKNQYKRYGKGGIQTAKPKRYPALGFGEKGETEIFVASPYKVGKEYFKDPIYSAILPYAEFEEEVANYYLKYIKNGLSLGNIINVPNSFNWTKEEKDAYEKSVKSRLTGSENANEFIISFNGDEKATTIESIKNEYAHKQWDFLTQEARQQILTGHKATSPSLVGVISSSGFASTADEMDEAEHQLMKRVISPKQDFIIDAIKEIYNYFDMEIELMFMPLTEKVENSQGKVVETTDSEEGVEEEVALKKKDNLQEFIDLGEFEDLETYDLIDEIEVDYNEQIELASTGTARPNAKSSQDGEDFIVRYKYVGKISDDTREFCSKMMNAGKIYRKEDIEQLTNKVVNAGWGANGADTYSIWLYKGGGSCHHKWNRVIYLKKGKTVDANSPLAEIISTSEARRKGFKIETNDTLVSIEPNNMTNNGFLKPR